MVVVSVAEATPGRCPLVQWVLEASAVVSEVVTRASTADVDGAASEEVSAAEEVASGVVVATSAVAIETDTAHRATRPLDLASTDEMVVMATEVIEATAVVTAEAIEALVGMIREAVAAHMTTDTVAAAAATATAADSETAITDVPEATWSPSVEEKVEERVDEKVGIATGTATTTGPATMTVAENVVMTVVTRIQGSCADTKAVFTLHGLLVGCRFSSSRH